MGGKLLRANIKAEGPLGGLTALDSSMRWSARCGHKRRQRGSSGENISYSHRWEKQVGEAEKTSDKDLCWKSWWDKQKGMGEVTGDFEHQWVTVGRVGKETYRTDDLITLVDLGGCS